MRAQHGNRVVRERRHYDLVAVSFDGIERRSSRENLALLSDDEIDESEMSLADEYWTEFFDPTNVKTGDQH